MGQRRLFYIVALVCNWRQLFEEASSSGNFRKYGAAIVGQMCIAGTHFVLSLVLLRILSVKDYGVFAFIFVVIQFSFSISNALLGSPLVVALARNEELGNLEASAIRGLSPLFSLLCGFVTGCIAVSLTKDLKVSAATVACAVALSLRWFGRADAYAQMRPTVAVHSDLIYAFLVLAGLLLTWLFIKIELVSVFVVLAIAAAGSGAALGRAGIHALFSSISRPSITNYRTVFMEHSRWSLIGVTATEATVNVHSYLVTTMYGPESLAVLAVSGLVWRPVQVVIVALTLLERPAIARAVAAGDIQRALRIKANLHFVLLALWAFIAGSAYLLLSFAPDALLSGKYDPDQVINAFFFWAAIVAVQCLRTPALILLQSVGDFRSLARASLISAPFSIVSVFMLLVLSDPVRSLAGVLLGEVVFAVMTRTILRSWRDAHG